MGCHEENTCPEPLPWGEVGATRRVRGVGPTVSTRDPSPHPNPLPMGEGAHRGGWGGVAVETGVFAECGSSMDCHEEHTGPEPLPWGEVGATRRVRGVGPLRIHERSQPLTPTLTPWERGRIAGVGEAWPLKRVSSQNAAPRWTATKKTPARNLSHGERSARKRRVRGVRPTVSTRDPTPSPQPSPHGRGGASCTLRLGCLTGGVGVWLNPNANKNAAHLLIRGVHRFQFYRKTRLDQKA